MKMMDLSNEGRFVVYKKNEILRLEERIHDLVRENNKLKSLNEKCRQLESENQMLKSQLSRSATNDSKINLMTMKGSDQSMTMDFIANQESKTNESMLRTTITPNVPNAAEGQASQPTVVGQQPMASTQIGASDSPEDSSHLALTRFRRKSNFSVQNDNQSHEAMNCRNCEKQNKMLNNVWSFPEVSQRSKGLEDLARQMRNRFCDQTIMFKLIAKEWDRKPENMSRLEFFYHLLAIFVENCVQVTHCTDHQPPCRPKVNASLLERNAVVLKNFIQSVNRYKLIVIEVELLAALENLVYAQHRYRPAVADIMDILFRKGVVEAVAFGEWSSIESHRPEDKARLIQEVKANGFNLLKRSSSL